MLAAQPARGEPTLNPNPNATPTIPKLAALSDVLLISKKVRTEDDAAVVVVDEDAMMCGIV